MGLPAVGDDDMALQGVGSTILPKVGIEPLPCTLSWRQLESDLRLTTVLIPYWEITCPLKRPIVSPSGS